MKRISRRRFLRAAGAAAAVTGAFAAGGAVKARALAAQEGFAQTALIEAFPWGPGVAASILELAQPVRADSVRAADFRVTERKRGNIPERASREVTAAYPCTREGDAADGDSRYLRLELRCTPETGSPFYYSIREMQNRWCGQYSLEVSLARDAALCTAQGEPVQELHAAPEIDLSAARIPALEGFDCSGVFPASDGRTLRYAAYRPASEGRLPLVIWLHGAGEGGADPRILLLGNEVTRLAGAEFQAAMGGAAYILAPQAPTFWMEYDEAGSWHANPGTASVYTAALKELIDAFVAANPRIDPARILIGGCSNGGYMALNMILHWPEAFAAGFPICEAYRNSGLTDGDLRTLLGTPLWFVYAQNDRTVRPEEYAAPTIARLRKLGAALHASVFPDVRDTTGLYAGRDGSPYQYAGHWSWVYFFQNQCADSATGETMWSWMGRQRRQTG